MRRNAVSPGLPVTKGAFVDLFDFGILFVGIQADEGVCHSRDATFLWILEKVAAGDPSGKLAGSMSAAETADTKSDLANIQRDRSDVPIPKTRGLHRSKLYVNIVFIFVLHESVEGESPPPHGGEALQLEAAALVASLVAVVQPYSVVQRQKAIGIRLKDEQSFAETFAEASQLEDQPAAGLDLASFEDVQILIELRRNRSAFSLRKRPTSRIDENSEENRIATGKSGPKKKEGTFLP